MITPTPKRTESAPNGPKRPEPVPIRAPRRLPIGLLAGLVALLSVLAAAPAVWRHVTPAATPAPTEAFGAAETRPSTADARTAATQRIRAHLAGTERALRARDVSHLPSARRAARARALDALADYRRRGVFPHNHGFPGERRPYFVDAHGTLCAMAYLIARSGENDLVRRIAATRNNAYVRELADDPVLVAWLDRNGLTAAEAARIQPQYGWRPEVGQDDAVERDYALGSFITAGLGGASIVLNWPTAEPRDELWPAVLGSAAGIYGIALGAAGIGEADARPGSLAALNLGIGAAATALAGHAAWITLRDSAEDTAADGRAAHRTGGRSCAVCDARIAISPALIRDGPRTAPGLTLRIGF